MKLGILAEIIKNMEEIRRKKPLIHNITNYVTVNDCANAVLAIGASPVMADAAEEVEDIVAISSALVLNIGTLNRRTAESMLTAGKKANELQIPVVFDPVGAGASGYRNRVAERLLTELKITVLRGNSSEIRSVAGFCAETKGVDASEADLLTGIRAGKEVAMKAAEQFGCVTAVTGPTDVICDGKRTVLIENGSRLLSSVTGTGCMCTSLIGAFCGAGGDPFAAAAGGVLSMSLAGELAQEIGAGGNGSYHLSVIDQIGRLNAETLAGRAKIHEA